MKKIIIASALVLSFAIAPVAASAQDISIKQLVELFIGLGIISPEKAGAARSAVGITSNTSVTPTPTSTAAPAKITVVTPNGGQRFESLQKVAVYFTTTLPVGTSYEVSLVGFAYDRTVAFEKVKADPIQSVTFVMPAAATGSYRVRVSDASTSCESSIPCTQDQSDRDFTVVSAGSTSATPVPTASSIKVLSPNGGEKIQIGTPTWLATEASGYKGNISYALYTGDSTFKNRNHIGWIGNASDTFIKWDAKTICQGFNGYTGVNCTMVQPGNYKIFVSVFTGQGNDVVEDISDAAFTLIADSPKLTPILTVDYPNGGESFTTANTINVRWLTSGVSFYANIDRIRLRSYSTGQEYYLATDVKNAYGTASVVLPSTIPDGYYKLEIKTYVDGILVTDASNNYFKIGAPVSTVTPTPTATASPSGTPSR